MSGHDALGERMKGNYESRVRLMLPRRSYIVTRLDGRAFHSYTRGLDRPYDQQLMDDMAETARYLCEQVDGCRMAYTQSDEISLLATDFESPRTQAWFDGNQQKIVSITAALATAKFNELRPGKLALFDSRAFTIPDRTDVVNYFVWRGQDCTRNSISMAAQAHFSHKQLHGKTGNEMQEMLWRERYVNWNDYDPRFKRGTVVVPVTSVETMTYTDKRTGVENTIGGVERTRWEVQPAPIFTQDVAFMDKHIPSREGQ